MEISPFNGLKCLAQASKIEQILEGKMPYPTCAQIDVSNICNHKCKWCFYQSFKDREKVIIPKEKILSLIDELSGLGVESILFTGGGEPLVHPNICEIIRRASDKGLKVGMSSNGGLLYEKEKQDVILECNTYLRISLDAGTDKTHSKLHGCGIGEYFRILSNIKDMSSRRKRNITIGYAFLVSNDNYFEIEKAVENAIDNGFDYIEFRPIIGGTLDEEATAVSDFKMDKMRRKYPQFKILGTIDRFEELRSCNKGFSKCLATPLITIIGADMKVYLCCQWRGNLNYVVGDITNKRFREVWDSEAHKKLVKSIDVSKCYPCKYRNYNIAIERVFINDEMHINFL